MTEQAKFNKPVNDWSSVRDTFLRAKNAEIKFLLLSILSRGKRASERMESNSIPANDKVVAGPHVFSGAMGMPK